MYGGQMKKILFSGYFIFMFSFPAVNGLSAQDDSDFLTNRFSVGMDRFLVSTPLNAELRWWKSEDKGLRLILNSASITYEYDRNSSGVETKVYSGAINSFQITWLKRKNSIEKRMSFYRGIGIEPYFRRENYSNSKVTTAHVYCRIPVGVEHFFSKKFPSLSYSFEADFYAGLDLYLYKYNTGLQKSYNLSLNMGLTPRFFLHLYF